MNMDNRELYDNLPEGYLKNRKRWDLFYVLSLYAYCIFSVITLYGIVTLEKYTYNLFLALIIGINILTVMMSYTIKRVYKHMEITYYGEVKVFTKMEIFLYALPVIIVIPFILEDVLIYLGFIVAAYIGASSMTRPLDAIDEVNKWKH